ncbi:hypothetical protein BGZ97_009683, partial [Linnemannia gamsii]
MKIYALVLPFLASLASGCLEIEYKVDVQYLIETWVKVIDNGDVKIDAHRAGKGNSISNLYTGKEGYEFEVYHSVDLEFKGRWARPGAGQ